ncbi:MAG: oligosaccharide flippase family protein, partial [Myxococcota bacterium]
EEIARDAEGFAGVAKLLGFAAFAYLARTLEPDSYGAVELAAALGMFFTLVVDFGLGPIGAREITRAPSEAARLAAEIPAARLLLATLAVAAMWTAAGGLDVPERTRVLIRIWSLSLWGGAWTQSWLFQGLGRMSWVSPAQALRMGAFALAAVGLVSGPGDAVRVGIAECVGALAMALYYAVAQAFHGIAPRLAFHPRRLRRLWAEALPVGAGRITWALNQYAMTVLVAVRIGGAEVAWFGAGHRLVTSLGSFVNLYHFNLYPQIVRAAAGSASARATLEALLAASFRVTGWVGTLAAVGGTLLAGPICRGVYGAAFEASATSFAVLSWTLPLALVGAHARFVLIGYGRQSRELVANLCGAGIAIGIGWPAIAGAGAVGAAVAMVVSAFVTWGVAQYFARSLVPLPFLGPLLRPAALAALVLALSGWSGADGWLAGAIGVGSFAALGLVVEPELRRDLARALQDSRR